MQEEIVEYKVKSISKKDWKFKKSTFSNTAFKIYLNNCKDISYNECVETSNGNKFYPAHRSD